MISQPKGIFVVGGRRLEREIRLYSVARGLTFRVLAVLLALFLAGLALAVTGQAPIMLAARVLTATFGTAFGREQLLILATPLILLGAAYMLAARVQFWNLGLDGQLSVGAFAAAAIGLHIAAPTLPVLLIMMIAGAIGGALYALIAVWLRVRAGISEILTTLILNWVAIKWAEYIGRWAWTDASGGGLGANATPPIAYRLPVVTGDLHIGIFLAPIVVALLWVVLSNTVWGYQVASVGANPRAAEYGGIRVARQTILLVVLSGAIAGLAGVIDLTGVSHRFSAYLSPSYGFLGICVAILAGELVPALMLWGPFMALLQNGGIVLRASGLTPAIVGAITGLILILASVGEVVANYRLVRIITRGEMPTIVDAPGGGEPPGLDGRNVRDGFGS